MPCWRATPEGAATNADPLHRGAEPPGKKAARGTAFTSSANMAPGSNACWLSKKGKPWAGWGGKGERVSSWRRICQRDSRGHPAQQLSARQLRDQYWQVRDGGLHLLCPLGTPVPGTLWNLPHLQASRGAAHDTICPSLLAFTAPECNAAGSRRIEADSGGI